MTRHAMPTPLRAFVAALLFLTLSLSPAVQKVAAAADALTPDGVGSNNSCGATAALDACPCPVRSAAADVDPPSLYNRGGSAQAYKPSAPVKSTVCDPDDYAPADGGGRRESVLRVARWPLSRSSLPDGAPVVRITGRLLSCAASGAGGGGAPGGGSPPSPLGLPTNRNGESAAMVQTTTSTVEIWQARPDGTYSSLRPGIDEGDCRATVHPEADGTFRVETVSPGSIGGMGGIGPRGLDVPPYGPPVLHFLIAAEGHRPLLAQVEVAASGGRYNFHGPDLRGLALVGAVGRKGGNEEGAPVRVRSVGDGDALGEISIEVDFYLTREEDEEASGGGAVALEEALCPSWLYGLPRSFFTEPIAVCAPSMLDFFEL